MTVMRERNAEDTVDEAAPEDFDEVVRNALAVSGSTLRQLKAQARAGHFRTARARMAWIAISGIQDF